MSSCVSNSSSLGFGKSLCAQDQGTKICFRFSGKHLVPLVITYLTVDVLCKLPVHHRWGLSWSIAGSSIFSVRTAFAVRIERYTPISRLQIELGCAGEMQLPQSNVPWNQCLLSGEEGSCQASLCRGGSGKGQWCQGPGEQLRVLCSSWGLKSERGHWGFLCQLGPSC